MPINKAAYIRYKEINRCLRSSRNYTWEMIRKAVSDKLQISHPTINNISLRTIKYDVEFLHKEYNIILNKELFNKRPAILKYEDTNFSYSVKES